MAKVVSLILFVFLPCGIVAALHAKPADISCPANAGGYSHTELLEYATLAERAYDIPIPEGVDAAESALNWRKHCENDDPPKVEDWHVHNLPEDYIHRAAKTLDLRPTDYDVYTVKRTGEQVIVCNEPNPMASLAGTIRYAWRNDKLRLLTKIILVATEAFTEVEEIEVMELRSDDPSKPPLLGMQGTDIVRLWNLQTDIPRARQVNTTVRQLRGDSCPFNLMPEVAVEFFKDTSCAWKSLKIDSRPNDLAIVGHSLGGAVAQHVANEKDIVDFVPECSGEADTFRAFSFNSICLKDATPNQRQENVVSVRVAGELLEEKATEFNMKQIGHLYRYGLPLPDELNGLRIKRHRITEVQRQIRLCRCGLRKYQYTPAAIE